MIEFLADLHRRRANRPFTTGHPHRRRGRGAGQESIAATLERGRTRDRRERSGLRRMGSDVPGFEQIDQTQVAVVGGRARTWGSCRASKAYAYRLASASRRTFPADHGGRVVDRRTADRLSRLNPEEREAIRTLSAEIRRTLKGSPSPTIWRRRSRAPSSGSANTPPTPSDRARRRRIRRRPPSRASTTRS